MTGSARNHFSSPAGCVHLAQALRHKFPSLTRVCVHETSGLVSTVIGTSTLSKNKAKYAALRQAFIYIVQKLADTEMITKEDEAASLADVERAWAR